MPGRVGTESSTGLNGRVKLGPEQLAGKSLQLWPRFLTQGRMAQGGLGAGWEPAESPCGRRRWTRRPLSSRLAVKPRWDTQVSWGSLHGRNHPRGMGTAAAGAAPGDSGHSGGDLALRRNPWGSGSRFPAAAQRPENSELGGGGRGRARGGK